MEIWAFLAYSKSFRSLRSFCLKRKLVRFIEVSLGIDTMLFKHYSKFHNSSFRTETNVTYNGTDKYTTEFMETGYFGVNLH